MLKSEVKYILKKLNVPGAIISVKSKTYPSFNLEYGYSNLQKKTPMSIDDKFRIGSNTKMFVGIVLLQLYEEGLIDLDKPVNHYLLGLSDDFKNLTIREIGNMRSGVSNYFDESRFQKTYNEENCRHWNPAEMYALATSAPQVFKPGSQFMYSNSNTVILGLIIERLTGNSLEYEINKRIINKMGLSNTKFETDGEFKKPIMHGYQYFVENKNKLKDVTYYNPSWAWAAGNISSNHDDMSKFLKYAIGKHILLNDDSTKQQRQFHPIPNNSNLNISYGFHLISVENYMGHNGGISGYNTYMLYEIKTKTTLIVAVNLYLLANGRSPADIITKYIVQRLNNKISFKEVNTLLGI